MDAELSERVLECLRGLEIGESISADGIADEIGEKLSDVYDAIEGLEEARLVELHPAYRKGSDPTYTLTPKGKRYLQPEIQEKPEPEPAKEDQGDPESTCQYCGTIMASPARKRNHEPVCGKNPNRNQPTAESIRNHYEKPPVTEPRASADRVCRFCGKVLEPNKLRRHENCCGKNPDRPCTPLKFLKKAEPKEEAVEVPAPAEYAEAESNATATLEHEVGLLFVPNPDHCTGCLDYNRADGTCMVNCVTEESCNHAYRPREPQLQDVPSVDEILGQQQASEDPDVPDEVPNYPPANNAPAPDKLLAGFLERVSASHALVLRGSPGMDAALRLISFCQQMAGSGARVSVDATVQVSEGFHIHVDLCVPAGESDE